MNSHSSQTLLSADDPPPVRAINPDGASPFLLIGDHAGNAVPSALRSLGLTDAEMTRHIAWDIGIAALGERLSEALDAVFIRQSYSRLVIDCNRDPQAPDAIPATSDGTSIPANCDLSQSDRAMRECAIQAPYQAAIAGELARRDYAGLDTILISLHSFTPAIGGIARPWHAGVLHSDGDTSFAISMLNLLAAQGDLTIGDNQPYAMDGIDYTVPLHAFPSRRRYAEIEIRQDLLAASDQQEKWAALLAPLFIAAAERSR
ncbi:MAG TPA: N-formylglutamate amidohydrolase [Allosphingosinicella sp.]|nr:N-formylglutamate amidohydrolase [Allosphingosinicella sp.]